MGINGFHNFIKKRAPQVYRKIHFSEYAGKRVAIDVSGLIYKYKIISKDRWLDSFTYLILSLRRNRIHPIFVFDGVAPVEKNDEKAKRGEQRVKLSDKIFSLRQSLDDYYSTGEVSEILTETMKKCQVTQAPSLYDDNKVVINTDILEKKYEQIESQIVVWSQEELETLISLFDLFGVQHICAPTEAESMCASMALEGHVDAVVSNDSDVCAYGVSKFLYEINGMSESFIEIDFNELITALELTKEQFLDFCIMCGCDYNTNIPKVGPVNSYKLIKEVGSIENLIDTPTDCLNYKRCREIFTTLYPYEDTVLSEDLSEEDLIRLYNFLKIKSSNVKFEMLQQAFTPVEIVFE